MNTNSKSKQKTSKPSHRKSNLVDIAGLPSYNKKFQCTECGKEFIRKYHFLEHSTLHHPENHFPSKSKPDNWTHPQYKMYLKQLLKYQVNNCGSSISGYKCIYCKISLKEKRSVRVHLIKKHQDILSQNLAQMPMDYPAINSQDSKSKLKQFCKIRNRMKPEYTCSICQVLTTSVGRHKAFHHPENFLQAKRFQQVSLEQFKLYCVYLIDKKVENFTKSREDGKVRYHCNHCTNSYVNLQGCRNHLVLGHADLLSVEIEKLQQTVKPEELKLTRTTKRLTKEFIKPIKKPVEINSEICQICNVRLTQRGMLIHMKKTHPNEYLKSYKCEICQICKKTFRSERWLDFHKTSVHADVQFGKWKASNVSVDQFKSYCKRMIENELGGLGQVGKTDEVVRYKCSHCSTTFGDMKYAQTHLVMKHKEILGNKLKNLMQIETVSENKPDMVTKSVEFQERIAEDDDFEESEAFCAKSATEQEANESWDDKNDKRMDLDDLNESGEHQQDIEIKQENCKMDMEFILPN